LRLMNIKRNIILILSRKDAEEAQERRGSETKTLQ
jgi:hypothetical protein